MFCTIIGTQSLGKRLVGAIVIGLSVLSIACGSEVASEPTATPTQIVIHQPVATAAPTEIPATPTPAQTSTPVPTATPAAGYTTEGLVPVDIPEALLYHAEPLAEEQVEALWIETISDARHYIMDGAIVIDTCADGTGRYLVEASRHGQSFTWEVKKDPGGRWSEARALVTFNDPEIGKGPDGSTAIPLIVNKEGGRAWPTYSKTHVAETYVSPACTEA